MNNLGKAIGLILFMGIILTSCLLLVSKSKGHQITISVMHELDSLDNIYRVEAGMQKIPTEVFDNYCIEVMNHYKGQIRSIFYDPLENPRIKIRWVN